MAKEISKCRSKKIAQHIVETNEVFSVNCMHHNVEANEVVVSHISILETTATIIKHNYQC